MNDRLEKLQAESLWTDDRFEISKSVLMMERGYEVLIFGGFAF